MRIGTDLVLIARIARLASNEAFLDKIFHATELDYCRARGAGFEASLAARFAVKEAFGKALGTGIFSDGVLPKEIWVQNEPNGRPILQLSDMLRGRVTSLGFLGWDVSISHQGEYAIASVILF
jgi:holo-[acyl-carrier protein] synthase